MVCFTISSTERYRTLQQVALDVDRADTAACCDGGRTGAMLSAARAGHHSPPQYSMTPMAALERLSCSMAAIICVVQLVLDGHSASAARRVACHAQETHKRPWWGRVAKPLLCALPTLADRTDLTLHSSSARIMLYVPTTVTPRRATNVQQPLPYTIVFAVRSICAVGALTQKLAAWHARRT